MERTKRFPLTHLLFMALSAMLTGANGWEAIAFFASEKRSWLEEFFALPHGTPCADTFRRVFESLDSTAVGEAFGTWLDALHERIDGEHIALDGKAVRGAVGHADASSPLFLVQAFSAQRQRVLSQRVVEGASGEPQGANALLDLLALEGMVVTGDANFCTQALAARVCAKNGDYVFTLKGNRGAIHEVTCALFASAGDKLPTARRTSKGRGRVETRIVTVLPATLLPDAMRTKWAGLQTLVRITRIRTVVKTGETTCEDHYALTSLPPDPKRIANLLRDHWLIENQLHFVLDTALDEDGCLVRTKHSAAMLAMMRRLVLTLMGHAKAGKLSMPKKLTKAALSDDFRKTLIFLGTDSPSIQGK